MNVYDDHREWLDEDFKSSKAAVTLCLKDLGGTEDLPDGSILQIQSITNVSVPIKSHSEHKSQYDPKHHILKICLSDGKETCYGILCEPHAKLNTDTPPGTKIKTVRPIPFGPSRILRFTRGNVEVLGGYVEKMVEHWRVQKDHDKKSVWGKLITNPGEEGPPKFKPLTAYGSTGVGNTEELRNAKAMEILQAARAADGNEKKPEGKTEFDLQRQEAILDLAKQGSSKKEFSVSKQFPHAEPRPPPVPSFSRKEARNRIKTQTPVVNRDPMADDREPRKFSSRKAKQEEEELMSEYSYRGKQSNLSDFFTPTPSLQLPSNRTSEVNSMESDFGRMGIENNRGGGGGGGGRGGDFIHRGRGSRRGRGGRGRGRGRGSSYGNDNYYQEPPRTNSSYVPDLSSFPSL